MRFLTKLSVACLLMIMVLGGGGSLAWAQADPDPEKFGASWSLLNQEFAVELQGVKSELDQATKEADDSPLSVENASCGDQLAAQLEASLKQLVNNIPLPRQIRNIIKSVMDLDSGSLWDKVKEEACEVGKDFIRRQLEQCININANFVTNFDFPRIPQSCLAQLNINVGAQLGFHSFAYADISAAGPSVVGCTLQDVGIESNATVRGPGGLNEAHLVFGCDYQNDPYEALNKSYRAESWRENVAPALTASNALCGVISDKVLETYSFTQLSNLEINELPGHGVMSAGDNAPKVIRRWTGVSGSGSDWRTECTSAMGHTPDGDGYPSDAEITSDQIDEDYLSRYCVIEGVFIGLEDGFAERAECYGFSIKNLAPCGWEYELDENGALKKYDGIPHLVPKVCEDPDVFASACCDASQYDCNEWDLPACPCTMPSLNAFQNGRCQGDSVVNCCNPEFNDCTQPDYAYLPLCDVDLVKQCYDPSFSMMLGADGMPDTSQPPFDGTDQDQNQEFTEKLFNPYDYLVVRPDSMIDGQACCTTEWCNLCPGHVYAAHTLRKQSAYVINSASLSGAMNFCFEAGGEQEKIDCGACYRPLIELDSNNLPVIVDYEATGQCITVDGQTLENGTALGVGDRETSALARYESTLQFGDDESGDRNKAALISSMTGETVRVEFDYMTPIDIGIYNNNWVDRNFNPISPPSEQSRIVTGMPRSFMYNVNGNPFWRVRPILLSDTYHNSPMRPPKSCFDTSHIFQLANEDVRICQDAAKKRRNVLFNERGKDEFGTPCKNQGGKPDRKGFKAVDSALVILKDQPYWPYDWYWGTLTDGSLNHFLGLNFEAYDIELTEQISSQRQVDEERYFSGRDPEVYGRAAGFDPETYQPEYIFVPVDGTGTRVTGENADNAFSYFATYAYNQDLMSYGMPRAQEVMLPNEDGDLEPSIIPLCSELQLCIPSGNTPNRLIPIDPYASGQGAGSATPVRTSPRNLAPVGQRRDRVTQSQDDINRNAYQDDGPSIMDTMRNLFGGSEREDAPAGEFNRNDLF